MLEQSWAKRITKWDWISIIDWRLRIFGLSLFLADEADEKGDEDEDKEDEDEGEEDGDDEDEEGKDDEDEEEAEE